jgi:hypothetical protein
MGPEVLIEFSYYQVITSGEHFSKVFVRIDLTSKECLCRITNFEFYNAQLTKKLSVVNTR